MTGPAPASIPVSTQMWRHDQAGQGARRLAEETPVALVYDASTEAVMKPETPPTTNSITKPANANKE